MLFSQFRPQTAGTRAGFVMTWRKRWITDLTTDVTSAVLLTEPRCRLAFQCLCIFFGVINFFCKNAVPYFQNYLPPCDTTADLFYPAMTSGSHEHTLHFIDRETGSEWPGIAQGHTENDPCLSVSIAVPSSVTINSAQHVPSLESVYLAAILLSQLELLRVGMSDWSRSIEESGLRCWIEKNKMKARSSQKQNPNRPSSLQLPEAKSLTFEKPAP